MYRLLLPHRHAGRLQWGKAESIQLCYFWMGQVTTGAEAQFCFSYQRCVHRYRHKVWVAVTILLSADMTVPYGITSLCVCVTAKDI